MLYAACMKNRSGQAEDSCFIDVIVYHTTASHGVVGDVSAVHLSAPHQMAVSWHLGPLGFSSDLRGQRLGEQLSTSHGGEVQTPGVVGRHGTEKLRDMTPGGRPSAIADDLWCLRSHDDLLLRPYVLYVLVRCLLGPASKPSF